MKTKNNIFKSIIVIIIFFVLIEFCSYLIISSKIGSALFQVFKGINEFTENDLNQYLAKRDEINGWPIKSDNSLYNQYTKDGYRISSYNSLFLEDCISLYGDSFTFGSEVKHDEAWSSLLAKKLNCSVYNFGVPAYGVDQAVLRFKENLNFNSKLVILGIHPIDIQRNVTQNYALIASDLIDIFTFKPKFIINKNKLELIKIPFNSLDDGKLFRQNFKLFLNHDELINKYNKKLVEFKFPFSITLLNAGFVFFEKKIGSISHTGILPDDLPFWLREKESLKLNSKIIEYFFSICDENKRFCKVLIIPDYTSLNYYQTSGENINRQIYENDSWKNNVWDPTVWLGKKMNKNTCLYVGINKDCNGHYNKDGNKLLANYLFEKLNN